ncbi:hypothetical protein F4779DRAFT_129272 [Xylariaceae sp. FL0662B]|nr:hypothetical protein F4779DRAFT_129272 [Xylariaceae sp. FL0662B]
MMASSFAVSTPSPPGRVHTPGTPKHGYSDSWEPFSPRKSARISSQRSADRSIDRTPSPRSSSHHYTRSSRKSSDTFSTPAASPHKRRLPAMDSVRRASGALTAESAANAADSLGLTSTQKKPQATMATSQSSGMLPTPAKTPRKQPDEKAQASVRAVARNLFSSESAIMPSPRKKAKKYSGLTLESFTAEEVENPIEIFTDTRDRLPEVDSTNDNPFYGNQPASTAEPEPPKRRSKRKHVTIPGEGKQTIEEAIQREDGIVYVFRGKKIFRKFSTSNDADADVASTSQLDAEDQQADVELSTPRRQRPMTRSSIKPRLLFPPQQKKGKAIADVATEDEEAVTDIEDHVTRGAGEDDVEAPATPVGMVNTKVDTPEAPRFAPASPPTTARATRTGNKLHADDSPMKRPAKPRSPFDGWRRSKSRAGPTGQKRQGEALPRSDEASKRQRA